MKQLNLFICIVDDARVDVSIDASATTRAVSGRARVSDGATTTATVGNASVACTTIGLVLLLLLLSLLLLMFLLLSPLSFLFTLTL